jgi:histidinol dehydrogenase
MSLLRRLDLRGAGLDVRDRIPRPSQSAAGPVAAVAEIIAAVRADGDAALRSCTERFDGVRVDDLEVPRSERQAALARIEPALRDALQVAHDNVEAYHRAQVVDEVDHERDGIVVRGLRRPVERAGLYVPGGRASYPSTVLMTAIPARVAGVAELVLCVPPGPDGTIPDVVLAAAEIAGVDRVFRVGGAQAIAAMAYGTESVPAVDVIAGPGNVYVAIAKQQVAGDVGISAAFAGPSEVVVIADASVDPRFAAVDVVLQAEHGPNGLAWLVTWDEQVASDVEAAVEQIVAASPRRADTEATLAEAGWVALCDGPEQALAVSNAIAPEHLELLVADPEALLPLVRSAGAVFCGPWSPASVGDYLAGPNHVLPTNGTARFAQALRVDDFVKHIHVVTLDHAALAKVAPHVRLLAAAEGLHAHAESVRLRVEG